MILWSLAQVRPDCPLPEAASKGLDTIVFDENARPGGQLFKQIHKFFGSKEHKARIRGVDIGAQLVKQAEEVGAKVVLDAAVMGIFPHKTSPL